MRKDVREFIRRLEAVSLTVESTPGHYRVLRDGKPLRKANGLPLMLPLSPDTIRWRKRQSSIYASWASTSSLALRTAMSIDGGAARRGLRSRGDEAGRAGSRRTPNNVGAIGPGWCERMLWWMEQSLLG